KNSQRPEEVLFLSDPRNNSLRLFKLPLNYNKPIPKLVFRDHCAPISVLVTPLSNKKVGGDSWSYFMMSGDLAGHIPVQTSIALAVGVETDYGHFVRSRHRRERSPGNEFDRLSRFISVFQALSDVPSWPQNRECSCRNDFCYKKVASGNSNNRDAGNEANERSADSCSNKTKKQNFSRLSEEDLKSENNAKRKKISNANLHCCREKSEKRFGRLENGYHFKNQKIVVSVEGD
ncbi:hypothetical protein MHBO_004481, partial [Bonamia ostreae]